MSYLFGHITHIQWDIKWQKWAFWAVQAGSIPKKIFKTKVCHFWRWVFSCFHGQNKHLKFFKKYCSVRTKKLLNNTFIFFYHFFNIFFCVKVGYKLLGNMVSKSWNQLLFCRCNLLAYLLKLCLLWLLLTCQFAKSSPYISILSQLSK